MMYGINKKGILLNDTGRKMRVELLLKFHNLLKLPVRKRKQECLQVQFLLCCQVQRLAQ
jgi:hypothetical protein